MRKVPTAQVIAAGLAKPNSPWAWQELENHSLTAAEVAQIIDGLVAWMKREHPAGSSEPLSWLDNFLERLDARHLLTDDQKIRFLTALHGNVRLDEPVARMREGESQVSVFGECRYTWRHDFLGFEMMNAPQSVTVDGQPVKTQNNFDKQWSIQNLSETLFVSTLPPGKHKVKIEVLSALAAKNDLTGLPWNAPLSDWPPAKKRWTRTAELELTVYPRDAVIVSQTQDPALDPIRNGSLSVKSVIIRKKGNGAQAVLDFDVADRLSLPVSFDVSLRIGDQKIPCGALWAVKTRNGSTSSGLEVTKDINAISAELKEAEIILTPNAKPIEHIASVERIWGGQIVFSNVPLKRLDLGEAMQPQENIAPAASIPPQMGGGQQPPGATAAPPAPVASYGRLVLLAVPVLGLLLILAVVATVLLLAIKKWKSGAGKAIAIGCGVLVLGAILLVLLVLVASALFLGFRQTARQQRVVESQAMAQARPQSMQSANLSFGPVVERMITTNDANTESMVFVSLGKNALLKPPFPVEYSGAAWIISLDGVPTHERGFLKITPQLLKWAADNGVDLAFRLEESSCMMESLQTPATWLAGYEQATTPKSSTEITIDWPADETPGQFEKAAPGDIRAALERDRARPSVALVGGVGFVNTSIPYDDEGKVAPWKTLTFRTMSGAEGLMQVAGFNNNPRGVKIRYKLVQNGSGKN